jgi:nitrite reductase/ring-hydroxylating ferredoxin subunit/uncharacterized membrane protein
VYPVLERFIESQAWLDTVGDPLQRAIGSLYANNGSTGKWLKNFLNGTWLGHPLHPMLTDVPIGAWTTTVVLDSVAALTDNESLETAADITLATGLAAAAGAAVTGLTDWSDTYAMERKLGLLHGLTMIASFVTYSAALVARLSGSRSSGVALANTGYALAAIGAYFGGDEVYDVGYGINRTAFRHGPSEYVPVMPETDLKDNTPIKGTAGDVTVVLVKQGSEIYALDDVCVHAGCSLAGGQVQGRSIICPCHGSQYDLADGSVLNGPATMPEPHYDVRVLGGTIEVRAADD